MIQFVDSFFIISKKTFVFLSERSQQNNKFNVDTCNKFVSKYKNEQREEVEERKFVKKRQKRHSIHNRLLCIEINKMKMFAQNIDS